MIDVNLVRGSLKHWAKPQTVSVLDLVLAAGLQPLIDSQKCITLLSLLAPFVVLLFSHSPSPTWTYFASRFLL